MSQSLKLLILEDRPEDAELMVYELKRAGFDTVWERVEKAAEFKARLQTDLDLILADVNLPQFDGLQALSILNESGLDIPLIVVTGTYEEIALECIKLGATDYLLKDRLGRLGKAAANALEDRRIRREKLQAEEDLRLSEERYRSIFEGVQDAILIEDGQDRILDVNRRACELFGYEYDDFIGRDSHDLVAPGGTFLQFSGPVGSLPDHPIENLNIRANGEVFPIELTVQPQIIHGEQVYLLVVRDISMRKRMTNALQESIERFRNLAEASLDCILIADNTLHVTYANKTAEMFFGPDPGNMVDLFQEEYRESFRHAVDGARATGEGALLGRIDPVLVCSKQVETPAEVSVSTWAAGEQRFFSFIIRDLTEQQEARQEEQVQHRLAAVGQMAAGIAHDFNNALMPIGLYTEMILKDENISERMRDQMQTILKQADRAAKLTAQILDFSRQALLSIRPLDPYRFVSGLVQELFRRTFPSNIEFRVSEPSVRCVIKADSNRMQQVFLNLALNARDAMPEGGVLSFSFKRIFVTPETEKNFKLPSGDWIHIRVSDTGTGIPDETLPYIFEPFFTTKSREAGSGLGLSQVYGIISQHNGFIRAESTAGRGTTFHIYLPATDEFAVEREQVSYLQPRSSRETILVVEDDLVNRRTMCDILEYADYSVLAASDGEEALELFRQRSRSVDVVICDMILPGINGVELISGLRKVQPNMRVILMTGHPIQEEDRLRIEKTGVVWLLKPFRYDEVMRAIQSVLE